MIVVVKVALSLPTVKAEPDFQTSVLLALTETV
jgi:hypothetical protein